MVETVRHEYGGEQLKIAKRAPMLRALAAVTEDVSFHEECAGVTP